MTVVSVGIHPGVHGLRLLLPTHPNVQRLLVAGVSVVGGRVIEGNLIALAGPPRIIGHLFLTVLVRPVETWEVSSMIH